MAILIANDGDQTVVTIGARNALNRKFDGMNVTVLDAIADVSVGGGEAGYVWRASTSSWVLTWKENKDNLIFTTETAVISNGSVTATHIPQNGIVWDCRIFDGAGLIVADVHPNVNAASISIGSMSFEGKTLSFTYGYGILQATVQSITKESVGLGNVDDTSDAFKPISTATQLALDLKADKLDTYTKAGTLTAILDNLPAPTAYTTLFEYGIADAYTKTETGTAIINAIASEAVTTSAEIAAAVAVETARATTAESSKAPQATTYTKTETDSRIQAIVGAAPAALDTLVEIAAQLQGDETVVAALTNAVSNKTDVSYVNAQLTLKANVATPTFVGTITAPTIAFTQGDITSSILITSTTDANQILDINAIATYRSAQYNIQMSAGTSYETTQISVIHDGFTAYISEIHTLNTGALLATFDVTIASGNLQLLVTPAVAITTIKFIKTVINV